MDSKKSQETIYLKDYKPIGYKVDKVFLHFDIFEHETIVSTDIHIKRENFTTDKIEIYGDKSLSLDEIKIDGNIIDHNMIIRNDEILYLPVGKRKEFILSTKTKIDPSRNLTLNGLYFSGGSYFTQNEPHGFRNITFFPDRPDVLTIYETKITASKKFEHLLSNGNLLRKGTVESNSDRHFAIWHDPYPKPSYLFALVVGSFDVLKEQYQTKSGRKISCEIYVDKGKLPQVKHAMQSLIKSMKWEEDTFGLEYDLDHYMIVAAESFNMGAMENKGLNIFNSKYVLGDEFTATDDDLDGIEAVIAHEYFHNWTGNRVTCRDWFQLTLKEGLTVFRDQWFTADQHGEVVKRIKDVQLLRQKQFDEDSGPLSHPIRPESYVEMNNFYTVTVYEKGAEVVRMLKTLVGVELFKKSLKHYLQKYDGQAATVEDFISSFEKVCEIDLSGFMHWYAQKGTPMVDIKFTSFGEDKFKLSLEQTIPGIPHPKILSLPLRLSLISNEGEEAFEVSCTKCTKSQVKMVTASETLIFMQDQNIELILSPRHKLNTCEISFNRNFSSPINLDEENNFKRYEFLAQYETDLFNKWQAFQKMLSIIIEETLNNSVNLTNVQTYALLLSKELNKPERNNYFTAMLFDFPSEEEINDQLSEYRFVDVRKTILLVQEKVATLLHSHLRDEFLKLEKEPNSTVWNSHHMGRRKLKNAILYYLILLEDKLAIEYCLAFQKLGLFNQEFMALYICNHLNIDIKDTLNNLFIEKHKHYPLIVDKWLMSQVSNLKHEHLINVVKELESSNYFDIKVPNKMYALFIPWMNNLALFNDHSGENYAWMIDKIRQVDAFNPRVASRLLKGFKSLSKLPKIPSEKLKSLLNSYLGSSEISKDCAEIVEKLLKG